MEASEAAEAKRQKKVGRKKIGQPISITVTPEQREWIDAQIPEGGTRTSVIRKLVADAMKRVVT